MRFHKTLGTKFKDIQDKSLQIKRPPVSATLRTYLQTQSQRIDNLLLKKRLHNQKIKNIQSQDQTYRKKLKNKIQQALQKHDKKRNQFLEKRSKQEKFKVDEVQRKRLQHKQKIKEAKKHNQQNFKRHKSQTVDFWNTKQFNTQKYYRLQASALPLHQDAVSRKKEIQKRNQFYSQKIKDQLLAKHSHVQQPITQNIKRKKQILQDYNLKLQKGYQKREQILQNKQKKIINDICLHKNLSEVVLKSHQKAYDKKLQTKHLIYQDNIDRKKHNLIENNTKRAQSMKQCKCHQRGNNPESTGFTQSIILNQQGNFSLTKTNLSSTQKSFQNFLNKSRINHSHVKTNKQILKQKQQIRNQRKLMIQKQITDAIKTRQYIKNQSNNLIRQARILG